MKTKSLLFLLLLLLAYVGSIQAQVTITTNIAPPYSSKLSDYASTPGKVFITLTNTSPTGGSLKVFLRATITGTNNNIKISTKPNYRPAQPLLLQAGIPYIVDLQTLTTLFDVNSFDLQNITTSQIFLKDGLPEGDYSFCVRAYNFDVPTLPVSSGSPFGCTNVRLTQLEPPILIKPFDKETKFSNSNTNVQNVIFNWNIPAGAEPGTQYVLRVIEMLDPSKNPNDAMNAKTTPAFFETTTSANIFLYGPAQPALVEGRKYSWSVTALPGIQGTAYKNNGRSEVRSFTYNQPVIPPPPKPVSLVQLTYPANNQIVKPYLDTFFFTPQKKTYLTWDYDSKIKASTESPIVVVLRNGQTPEQAIRSNPNLVNHRESKSVLFNAGIYEGEKIAWQVTIVDNKGNSFSSDIQTFKVTPASVTLIYPKDKDFVPDAVIHFQWVNSASFYKSESGKIYGVQQKPTIVEIKPGQTPADAIKQNTNLFTEKSQGWNLADIDLSAYSGKRMAWKVDSWGPEKSATSSIDTFTVINFDKSLKNFTTFNLCGYPVKVTSITNIEGFNYKGTGTTSLYKNGPTIEISFSNLTIQPFGSTKNNSGKVTTYTDWKATAALDSVKIVNFKKQSINLSIIQKNIPGSFTFDASNLVFTPFIVSHWDGATSHFIDVAKMINPNTTDADYAPNITGKFKWVSEFLNKDDKGVIKMAEFISKDEQTFKFDYNQKIPSGTESGAMKLNGDVAALLKPAMQANTEMALTVYLKMDKALQANFNMGGWYKVINPTDSKKNIGIDFYDKSEFEFETVYNDAQNIALNKDASCNAIFNTVHLNLSNNPNKTFGISIPKMKVVINDKSNLKTHPEFTFTSVTVDGTNGIKLNESKNIAAADQNIKFFGFDLLLKKINCNINKTELVQFKMEGGYTIPFINQKSTYTFVIDKNSLGNASIVFDNVQTNTLYNDLEKGDKCTFKPTYATMEFAKIVLNGNFNFSNKVAGKHMNVSGIASPKFAISPDGSLAMNDVYSSELDNTTTNPAGDFNGFKFTPYKMNLKQSNQSTYSLKLSGIMVLADNFSSKNSTNNFTTEISFDANTITSGGAAYHRKDFATFKEYHQYKKELDNKSVSFSTQAEAGSDNESSSFTGANLTYFDNDNVYGTGFKAELGYSLKSPVDPTQPTQSVNAVLWVGHKQEGYNYWFLEAGQKNFVTIPTGILDLTINGFKGRIYYHMRHDGDNINNSKYIPDGSKFIGVYAQVNLVTATDKGIKFWGDLAMEVATNNNGLESIKLLGNGNFITQGEGTDGVIKAKDCKLNLYWSPKKVTGDFNVELSAASQITINANAGFEIGDGKFHIWGSGSGSMFGQPAPASCGFDLDKEHVRVYGDFKIVDINWHNEGIICDDDIVVTSGINVDASFHFSPFQFKGNGKFYGSAKVQECGETIFSIGLGLNAQLQFPSPTCVSAGLSVMGFDFDAGIKNGSIIFSKCF